MRPILLVVMMLLVLSTPAFAAKLYLKDGGVIEALRVWRSNGKVHVLATRHTETSFQPYEVDMKRTFAKRHKVAKKPAKACRLTAAAAPKEATASQKPVEKKAGMSLSSMPKLPKREPQPSSGGEGTIRQHRKAIADRIAE